MTKEIRVEIVSYDLSVADIFTQLQNTIIAHAKGGDNEAVKKLIQNYNSLSDYMQSRGYNEPIQRLKLKSHSFAMLTGSERYTVEYNEKLCAFCGRERSVAIVETLTILPNHPFRMSTCGICHEKRYPEFQKKQESAYALVWGNAVNIFTFLPEVYKEEANKFLLSLLTSSKHMEFPPRPKNIIKRAAYQIKKILKIPKRHKHS